MARATAAARAPKQLRAPNSGFYPRVTRPSVDRGERRHDEMQMKLEHTNRVVMMGPLMASVPHEVNQPIAAMVMHAEAALGWLDHQPPELERVRQALASIVKNGNRAGDVIG